MSKSKRLLCVIMACVLMLGTLGVGASAYASYSTPQGFNSVGKPVYTFEQSCSMLCDYIDALLYEQDIYFEKDIVVATLTFDLRSIDGLYWSIEHLLGQGIWTVAKPLIGDLKKLNGDAVKGVRRTSNNDSAVLYALVQFLYDNRSSIIGKLVDGSINWGLVDNFADLPAMITNLPVYLKETVYRKLEGLADDAALPANYSVDVALQDMVNGLIIGELDTATGKYSGFLPCFGESESSRAKISLSEISFYDFVQNLIDAALADIAIPLVTDLLVEKTPAGEEPDEDSLMIVTTDEFPYGEPGHGGIAAMVPGIVNIFLPEASYAHFTWNENQFPLLELERYLHWLLLSEDATYTYDDNNNLTGWSYAVTATPVGLNAIFSLEDGFTVDQPFNDALVPNLITFIALLPGLGSTLGVEFLQGLDFPDEATLRAMDPIEMFALIIRQIVPNFLEVRIPASCNDIESCVFYIVRSFAMDILPEIDYSSLIQANGKPVHRAYLEIGADLLVYYLNSVIDVNLSYATNFEGTLEDLIDWAVDRYGVMFNVTNYSSYTTVWQKLDATVFDLIPLNWLCGDITGSEDLIMDTIFDNLVEFRFGQMLSFIGKNNGDGAAEFHQPVVPVVLSLVTRVLNAACQGIAVLPTGTSTLKTLDAVFEKSMLRSIVENFIVALNSKKSAVFPKLLPLVAMLMGLQGDAGYKVEGAPETEAPATINQLRQRLYSQQHDNTGLICSDDGYVSFGEVDFTPQYIFNQYKDWYKKAYDLLKAYEVNPYLVNPYDITDTYYCIGYYYDLMTQKSTFYNRYLVEEINYATSQNYADLQAPYLNGEVDLDGIPLPPHYSLRSWNNYVTALNFANDVVNSSVSNLRQSLISDARKNLYNAQKALTLFTGFANYAALDGAIDYAESRIGNDLSKYTTNTANAYSRALSAAKNLPRDYDTAQQNLINSAASALTTARMNLEVWELSYELGASFKHDDTMPVGTTGIVKFRESTGATVTNVSLVADNGATLTQLANETGSDGLDYYRWEINTANVPVYSLVNLTATFTQPSTGSTYSASSAIYVNEGAKKITITNNTVISGYIRNLYTVELSGCDAVSTAAYTNSATVAANPGTSPEMNNTVAPAGYLYVDCSKYTNLTQIPNLSVSVRKSAASYGSEYSANSVFTASTLKSIVPSNTAYHTTMYNAAESKYNEASFTLNQNDAKTYTFSGAVPAAGQTKEIYYNVNFQLTCTSGGNLSGGPKFKLVIYSYDKTALRSAVQAAQNACRQSWFYESGWTIYKRDLNNAIKTLLNPTVSQAQINEATSNLLESQTWLKVKNASFENLRVAMAAASALNPLDYENYSVLGNIIANINFDETMLEQSYVNELATNIYTAIGQLVSRTVRCTVNCYDINGTQVQSNSVVLESGSTSMPVASSNWYAKVGQRIMINVPQVLGYSSTDTAKYVTITNDPEANVYNFYYTPNQYRITLNTNGGTCSQSYANVTYGTTYANLPVPTLDGYDFAGWFTKLSGGTLINEETPVTTSTYRTLYAHWTETPEVQSNGESSAVDTEVVETVKGLFQKLLDFLAGSILGEIFSIITNLF